MGPLIHGCFSVNTLEHFFGDLPQFEKPVGEPRTLEIAKKLRER